MLGNRSHSQISSARETRLRLVVGLPYLPIALLIFVALSQFILAHTVDLSPWLGGGFGMFSTTDDGVNRELRVFTTGAEGEEEREIPETLADLEQRARVLPSPPRLRAFATPIFPVRVPKPSKGCRSSWGSFFRSAPRR
jgi:hypothetical protein